MQQIQPVLPRGRRYKELGPFDAQRCETLMASRTGRRSARDAVAYGVEDV
jgi:hypothetical protein